MDDDKSGEVSFDELENWLSFRPQRRRIARKLTLEKFRPANATPLSYLHWSPGLVKSELQRMCEAGHISALDLLGAYDRSEDGMLSQKEFLNMMRHIISCEKAWHLGAKAACETSALPPIEPEDLARAPLDPRV